ncbi:MAG: RNA polymerase subunit sigma-70 [Clostridia bacterium]|nr:RNA polymerase subunit sigma-70 [Clostridia bacterium]
MNEVQKEELINLKNEGRSYKEIAYAISVPESAVKSFFSRKKLKAEEIYTVCKNCGVPLTKRLGNKKFCSDLCRYEWWRNNTIDNRKCVKISICKKCGKELKCYDNKNRKYCSHACYTEDRFRNRKGNQNYDQ